MELIIEKLVSVLDTIPTQVLVASAAVIMLVYISQAVASIIEKSLEEKSGKQIKIFDHKKIWLSLFWCIMASVILAVAGYITWRQTPFYGFVIMGISTFCYEAVIKRLGMNDESES